MYRLRHGAGLPLAEGYAPFCKHVFVPNFIEGTKVGAVAITVRGTALL